MPTSVLNKTAVPRCALVCVGSELLRGKLNTHASHISRRLASIGLVLNEENTVSDEHPQITAAICRALDTYDVVLVSGGLGPTFDDVTREAAAEATGRSLVLSPPLLKDIQRKFRRARYKMPKANARQAYLLEDAQAIPNNVGTAPGQWLELPKTTVDRDPCTVHRPRLLILLPGPPRELYPMLESVVLPRLRKLSAGLQHAEAHLHFVGVPESIVDAMVRPIIQRESSQGEQVEFTILAHLGLVDFDVFVSSPSRVRARTILKRIVLAVRKAVGKAWYGSDQDYPLEKVVGNRLRHLRATLAVAESCTGGMLASRLTDMPGSSAYFVAGVVSYANSAKLRNLNVPESVLRKHGAVSRQTALAMAQGIRIQAATTWGLAITGIAGPTGGDIIEKPVGLVFIALSSKNRGVCKEYHFSGDRNSVRQRAVIAALDLLRHI